MACFQMNLILITIYANKKVLKPATIFVYGCFWGDIRGDIKLKKTDVGTLWFVLIKIKNTP